MLLRFVKAQNISREMTVNNKLLSSIEDALKHNYELGFIHGQRSVIALPQTIVTMRDEAFQEILALEREYDGRTDRQ